MIRLLFGFGKLNACKRFIVPIPGGNLNESGSPTTPLFCTKMQLMFFGCLLYKDLFVFYSSTFVCDSGVTIQLLLYHLCNYKASISSLEKLNVRKASAFGEYFR